MSRVRGCAAVGPSSEPRRGAIQSNKGADPLGSSLPLKDPRGGIVGRMLDDLPREDLGPAA